MGVFSGIKQVSNGCLSLSQGGGNNFTASFSREKDFIHFSPPLFQQLEISDIIFETYKFDISKGFFTARGKKDFKNFQRVLTCWKFVDLSEKVYFEISCLFTVATVSNFRNVIRFLLLKPNCWEEIFFRYTNRFTILIFVLYFTWTLYIFLYIYQKFSN